MNMRPWAGIRWWHAGLLGAVCLCASGGCSWFGLETASGPDQAQAGTSVETIAAPDVELPTLTEVPRDAVPEDAVSEEMTANESGSEPPGEVVAAAATEVRSSASDSAARANAVGPVIPLPPTAPGVGSRGNAVLPYGEWGLQETAIDALGRIGEPAVAALEQMLNEPAPESRVQAAYVLARIGPDAKKAVPQLIEALRDSNFEVRKAAARALGQIGPEAAPAVEALIKVIQETATVPNPVTVPSRLNERLPTPPTAGPSR